MERTVTVQCTHRDAVVYPVDKVEISVQGRVVNVDVVVSVKLPYLVFIRTDVPELVSLLRERTRFLWLQTEPSLQEPAWAE